MVATAPSTLAGPPAQGRSTSRIASDRQEATWVSPENAVSEQLARAGGTCIGRPRPHHRDSHRGRRRFSSQTRSGRYSWARYYHPSLQRFISEDPLEFGGGDVNLYVYVANAPVQFVDPTGMSIAPGAFPEYCQDPIAIPMTPELSGRKGSLAQVLAAELAFLGLVGRALDCSVVGVPGMVQGGGAILAGGGRALAHEIGILRDAARGKGNFGLGSATRAVADKLGRAWVGKGHRVASDGKTLISADGLRQYRPPALKPNRGIEQANFERRLAPAGQWLGNGHLDVTP